MKRMNEFILSCLMRWLNKFVDLRISFEFDHEDIEKTT